MIGPSGLVNDGLTAECVNNGGITWTYNQGVILGGLAALHELTGDQGYLRQGEAIADAALRGLTDAARDPRRAVRAVRLRRRPDAVQGHLRPQPARVLARHSGKPDYPAFIVANADSVLASAASPAGEFGLRWAGPFDKADASRQASALEVVIAAAVVTG